jgi:hypothetical protein
VTEEQVPTQVRQADLRQAVIELGVILGEVVVAVDKLRQVVDMQYRELAEVVGHVEDVEGRGLVPRSREVSRATDDLDKHLGVTFDRLTDIMTMLAGGRSD